jgi:hypothetical protein
MVPFVLVWCDDPRARVQITINGATRSPFLRNHFIAQWFSAGLSNGVANLVLEPALKAWKLINSAATTTSIEQVLKFIVGGSKSHTVSVRARPSQEYHLELFCGGQDSSRPVLTCTCLLEHSNPSCWPGGHPKVISFQDLEPQIGHPAEGWQAPHAHLPPFLGSVAAE